MPSENQLIMRAMSRRGTWLAVLASTIGVDAATKSYELTLCAQATIIGLVWAFESIADEITARNARFPECKPSTTRCNADPAPK